MSCEFTKTINTPCAREDDFWLIPDDASQPVCISCLRSVEELGLTQPPDWRQRVEKFNADFDDIFR